MPFEGQFVAWQARDLEPTPFGTLFNRYEATLQDGTVVATLWAEAGLDVAVI